MSSHASQEERTAAFIACLLTAYLGIIGAVIGWAVFKAKGPFARNQATEALNWAITLLLAFIALWVLVFALAGFTLSIVAALKANDGTACRFPFAVFV